MPTNQHGDAVSKYRIDIDGMRAIAVLLVVVFHFQLIAGGKAGFIGVDVFFVISGFLITSIIRRQLDEHSFSIKNFYLRRIRRLAPALFAVLLGTMMVGLFLLFPADLVQLAKEVLLSQTYVSNIYYWRSINYFGLSAQTAFLLHTWSLAVEEQFYLLYPLGILLLHRYLPRYFWAALTVGLILSFALNILFVQQKPEATFYLLPTRAWELLAGGLVAGIRPGWALSRAVNELLGILGLGLILGAVVLFREEFRVPGFFALLPTFATVCLILSGMNGATWTSRLLSLRPLTYIGKLSYSLYLVHWPVDRFAAMLLNEGYGVHWRFAALLFSFAVSAVIYHAIENPVRQRVVVASDRRLARAYLSGLAATLLIFSLVHVTGGLPGRFSDDVVQIARYASDKADDMPQCEFAGKARLGVADFCRIGASGGEPQWLVYGDSHAWAAQPAFDKWLRLKGQAGIFMFRNSCPPVHGIHLFHDTKDYCFAFNRAVLEFLQSNGGIRDVLLVSTWRQPIEALLSTSPDLKLSKDDSVRLFDIKFSETMEHLNRLGKRIYVWEPVPGARQNVPLALASAALRNKSASIEIGLDEYDSTYQYFFTAMRKNWHLIAGSFSPSQALCGTGRCAVSVNGIPVYFDNAHVTASSADFWVRMMQLGESRSKEANPRAPTIR